MKLLGVFSVYVVCVLTAAHLVAVEPVCTSTLSLHTRVRHRAHFSNTASVALYNIVTRALNSPLTDIAVHTRYDSFVPTITRTVTERGPNCNDSTLTIINKIAFQ